MTSKNGNEMRVGHELAELKRVLRAMPVPRQSEAALRHAFRSRRLLERSIDTPPGRDQLMARLALAASLAAVALGSLLWWREYRVPNATVDLSASSVAETLPLGFQRIEPALGVSPVAAYSVVRVRVPLSSLAMVPGATLMDGSIEADLLVGEDGLAHAIRFESPDARRLSVAGN